MDDSEALVYSSTINPQHAAPHSVIDYSRFISISVGRMLIFEGSMKLRQSKNLQHGALEISEERLKFCTQSSLLLATAF
jgi:hypothetical protein